MAKATYHLRVPPTRKRSKPLFDMPKVDVARLIRACRKTGKLTVAESIFLASLRKPRPGQWKLLWKICEKCGVE